MKIKNYEVSGMKESVIVDKSKAFALRIIKLYRYLCAEKQEYVLSKQLLRSGTSIGVNVREAKRAQSKPDFYSKMISPSKKRMKLPIGLNCYTRADFSNHKRLKVFTRIVMSLSKFSYLYSKPKPLNS